MLTAHIVRVTIGSVSIVGPSFLVVLAVAEGAFLFWLFYSLRRVPDTRGETLILRSGLAPILIGFAIIALALFVAGLFLLLSLRSPDGAPIMAVILGIIIPPSTLGLWTMSRVCRSMVIVSPRGIAQLVRRGGTRHLAWRHVRTVEYRGIVGALVVGDGRGKKVSVGLMLRGFQAFRRTLQAHVPEDLWRQSIARLHAAYPDA